MPGHLPGEPLLLQLRHVQWVVCTAETSRSSLHAECSPLGLATGLVLFGRSELVQRLSALTCMAGKLKYLRHVLSRWL